MTLSQSNQSVLEEFIFSIDFGGGLNQVSDANLQALLFDLFTGERPPKTVKNCEFRKIFATNI
jgi:hypothetical protein